MPPPSLAFCPTPHGYGHAVRLAEVARVLRLRHPHIRQVWLVAEAEILKKVGAPPPDEVALFPCGMGVIQSDALTVDRDATALALESEALRWEEGVEGIASLFGTLRATAALCDLPPQGILGAKRAGIPALALGNFGWDFIYSRLGQEDSLHVSSLPASPDPLHHSRIFQEAAHRASRAFSHTDLLWELPFAAPMLAFPRRRPLPWIAREATHTRGEVRSFLGIDATDKLALWSYGGNGSPETLPSPPGWRLMADDPRLSYPDLVGAADAVVSKLGYGILSDCLANHTPLLFAPRPHWPEEEVLRQHVGGILPCLPISRETLGNSLALAGALDSLSSLSMNWPADSLEGATLLADALASLLK